MGSFVEWRFRRFRRRADGTDAASRASTFQAAFQLTPTLPHTRDLKPDAGRTNDLHEPMVRAVTATMLRHARLDIHGIPDVVLRVMVWTVEMEQIDSHARTILSVSVLTVNHFSP
jgi:hypothetical protein